MHIYLVQKPARAYIGGLIACFLKTGLCTEISNDSFKPVSISQVEMDILETETLTPYTVEGYSVNKTFESVYAKDIPSCDHFGIALTPNVEGLNFDYFFVECATAAYSTNFWVKVQDQKITGFYILNEKSSMFKRIKYIGLNSGPNAPATELTFATNTLFYYTPCELSDILEIQSPGGPTDLSSAFVLLQKTKNKYQYTYPSVCGAVAGYARPSSNKGLLNYISGGNVAIINGSNYLISTDNISMLDSDFSPLNKNLPVRKIPLKDVVSSLFQQRSDITPPISVIEANRRMDQLYDH